MKTEAQKVDAKLVHRNIGGSRKVTRGGNKRTEGGVKNVVFFSYNATNISGSPRCEFSLLSEVGQPYRPFFDSVIKGLTLEIVEIDTAPWVVTVINKSKPQ